jgi:hypothetical protein
VLRERCVATGFGGGLGTGRVESNTLPFLQRMLWEIVTDRKELDRAGKNWVEFVLDFQGCDDYRTALLG